MVHNDDIARKRQDRNRYSRTNHGLSSEADKLGLAGEMAFANLMGLQHTPQASSPTRGYQFNLGPNKRIKITTSRTPGHLYVKENQVNADVYILAGCTGEPVMENVFWCGWSHKSAIEQAEVIVPTRKGAYVVPAHSIARADLIDMTALLHALDRDIEHLHRFPLSENGGHPVPHRLTPNQRSLREEHRKEIAAEQAAYKPLPLKRRAK